MDHDLVQVDSCLHALMRDVDIGVTLLPEGGYDLVTLIKEATPLLLQALSIVDSSEYKITHVYPLPPEGPERREIVRRVERQAFRRDEGREWLQQTGVPIVMGIAANPQPSNKPNRLQPGRVADGLQFDVPSMSVRQFQLWLLSSNQCTAVSRVLKFLLDALICSGTPLYLQSKRFGKMKLEMTIVRRFTPDLGWNPFYMLMPGTELADREKVPFAQTYYAPGTKHDILELHLQTADGAKVRYYMDPTVRQLTPDMPESAGLVRFFPADAIPEAYHPERGVTPADWNAYNLSPESQAIIAEGLWIMCGTVLTFEESTARLAAITQVLNRYLPTVKLE